NPLGGCLPILVQIPVFIALYWVLLGSVEMRHAPWLGWIQDLSAKDPYFILPVIMGASMLIQMRLNPTPPDPIQAKVMMGMPIIFTFMFLWFPSGLVLYWVVNNILSIAQQWQITRMIESAKPGTTVACHDRRDCDGSGARRRRCRARLGRQSWGLCLRVVRARAQATHRTLHAFPRC